MGAAAKLASWRSHVMGMSLLWRGAPIRITKSGSMTAFETRDLVESAPMRRPGSALQALCPGSELKYFSNLPATSLKSSASAGASPLRVMFGHFSAYSVFNFSH